MNQEFVRDLISFCDSIENADKIIDAKVESKGIQAKIDFLEDLYGLEVLSRNDPIDTSQDVVLANDYYALLGSVVNLARR